MTEPWCWPKHWVDRLTFVEMERIRATQREKVKAMQTETNPQAGGAPAAPGQVKFADRETAVKFMVGVLGMTPEAAAADYAKAAAGGP